MYQNAIFYDTIYEGTYFSMLIKQYKEQLGVIDIRLKEIEEAINTIGLDEKFKNELSKLKISRDNLNGLKSNLTYSIYLMEHRHDQGDYTGIENPDRAGEI